MTATPPLIDAADLTVRFGEVVALDALTLSVPAGEVVAVLGPNGAGKTTLVRAIATLLQPTSGRLRVHGVDASRDPRSVRRDIGLAGQCAAVEPTMTGRENLEMTARLFGHPKRAARKAAATVIDQLSLTEVADRRCGTYSGGQRRRLDLGASLVGAPRLLLLDEPTTGLDPTSRREVWDFVRALVAGGTDVLLTTHYLDEANELADRVIVIDHGRTIASGSLGEVKANAGKDVIELTADHSGELDTIARVLGTTTAQPTRIDRGARRVSSASTGGTEELGAVIAALADAAIDIEEIGIRRPTLDEVFLSVTGATPTADRAPAGVGG